MKYFVNESGEVFAYDDNQVAVGLADDKVAMTDAEVWAHENPPPALLTQEQVEAQRLLAYANPATGSDRYFAEATRLSLMGGTVDEIEAAKAQGVARYNEIQLENPWP